MNFSDYNELTINGHHLKDNEIVEFCKASDIENIKKLGIFIEDWLSSEATISVQTSGSTGTPKIITVQKQQMLQSAMATANFFNFKKGQTALLCLPVNYIAGKMMVVRALYSRLNLVCIEPNNTPLKNLPKDIQIDFAPLTPMQLKDTKDSSFVKTILLGGSPVSLEMESNFQKLSSEIYHGYGMTETLSHVALRKINGKDKSTIYQTLKGIKFSLDSRGCLRIEVPFLKEIIVTNDIVELISEQQFIWKGRADNVINSGGIKLFPEIIEQKIAPFIAEQYFVSGLPDTLLGEKLCLFIEGRHYTSDKLQILKNNLEENLEKYERPKEIIFIPEFKMTESGKIQRKGTIYLNESKKGT